MSITKNDNAVTLSRTALEYMAGLINKIVSAPEQLIDDVNLQTVTTFSSVRLNSLINETLQDAKDYTDEICGALVKLTCEKTTIQPTLDNSEKNVIYLYSADGNAPFQQYLKISDTELIDMGSTTISLNDYLTITDAVATYCKKTDFDGLNTEVTKVKNTLGTETLTTTSQTVTGAINELDSKSTIETLTQAEYNQLVADGKVDNDTYYIISDDSENLDLNKFNIKTYTTLEQLGLTVPVTVGDIYNAMPDSSLAVIPCGDISTSVTDVPVSFGILTIEKSALGRFSVLYKRSMSGTLVPNELYIGQLKGADGTGLSWKRVCTTSVADVSKTNIKLDSSIWSGGDAYYKVRNGICYVSINGLVPKRAGLSLLVSKSMPKTDIYMIQVLSVSNSSTVPTNPTMVRMFSDSTELVINSKNNTGALYGSFSYPVAES